MKIKHWLTALCALTMALLLTVPTAAEDDTGVSGTTATSEALDNIDLGSTDGVGGTALMWAIISEKQAKKEATA